MAGTRHHIIPRFYQKRFTSKHTEKDKYYTFRYMKGMAPIELPTKKISVENNFYGREDELSVDKIITDAEANKFAPFLNLLQTQAGPVSHHAIEIKHLITHLYARSDHIRHLFKRLGVIAYEKVFERFSDIDKYTIDMMNYMKKNNTLAEQERLFYKEQQEKYSLNLLDPRVTKAISVSFWRNVESNLSKEIKRKKESILRDQENAKSELDDLINGKAFMQNAHVKALDKMGVDAIGDENNFEDMAWTIHEFNEETLILGDLLAHRHSEELGCSVPAVMFSKEKSPIYLPISSKRLLIGYYDEDDICHDIDQINLASAQASISFFIAEKDDDLLVRFSDQIGMAFDQMVDNLESQYQYNGI